MKANGVLYFVFRGIVRSGFPVAALWFVGAFLLQVLFPGQPPAWSYEGVFTSFLFVTLANSFAYLWGTHQFGGRLVLLSPTMVIVAAGVVYIVAGSVSTTVALINLLWYMAAAAATATYRLLSPLIRPDETVRLGKHPTPPPK
jgi:hypothetical protein